MSTNYIKSIQEGVSYVEKITRPRSVDYEYSGISVKNTQDETNYFFTGSEEQLREKRTELLATGVWPTGEDKPGIIVTTELRRGNGQLWELSVTQQGVVGRADNEAGSLAKDAGKSRENALYSQTFISEPNNILLSPDFANLTNEQLSALKKLIDGANLTDSFKTSNGQIMTLEDYFTQAGLTDEAERVLRQSQYYVVTSSLKVSYKIAGVAPVPAVGGPATIKDPPNPQWALPAPYKWLFMGAAIEEQDDGFAWVVENYLSGEWKDYEQQASV